MKHLLYFLPLMLIAMHCKKDPEPPTVKNNESCDGLPDSVCTELAKLPPITQTGEGEIACLINGKAWIAKGGGSPGAHKYTADYYKGQLAINASRYDNGLKDYFWFGTTGYLGKGVFDINNKENCTIRYNHRDTDCKYDFDAITNGKMEISKIDTVTTGIVSGTFEFTAYIENETGCDTIRVSHGRFDVVL